MEIENESDKNTGILFPKGCNYGTIKSISFTKPGPFNLNLVYDQETPGFNSLLASYELKPNQIVEPEFK